MLISKLSQFLAEVGAKGFVNVEYRHRLLLLAKEAVKRVGEDFRLRLRRPE
ncbi:hypothetical protein Hden_0821 [Hyphomicrobium denitrificans ATCC 51888]|uniref:Uncharacterized protein n=1 Tax=Hyphomicrobium denitrificans (strain ATCC 51888 / DSM 1869 / NCIMB 11706 / TK 0415) TaxID=582899 RepID=D8JTS6_HYPDA|nr:hypothetical protein [Hyphomicrobium denitrificans]ADJ22638.1 hypothetical protein Hden_0821 [Hyphomicrobium denitrificans ATCC 51888]